MKEIINGKKCDTATAKMLGEREEVNYGNPIERYKEVLYRNEEGEYFLHVNASQSPLDYIDQGMLPIFGTQCIGLLSEEEAREWASDYLDCETFENIFGEVKE